MGTQARILLFILAITMLLFVIVVSVSAAPRAQKVRTVQDVWLHFDGVKDSVEIPDHRVLSPNTTGAFSISLWIAPATLSFPGESAGYVHIAGKGVREEHEYVFRFFNQTNAVNRSNRIAFYLFNASGGIGVGSYVQEPVRVGEWIHLVAVVNESSVTLYKNGVFRDSDVYKGIIYPSDRNASLRFGTRNEQSYFNGSIDEVRIYNRSLHEREVAALYRSGRAINNSLVSRGLVGWWSLNEGSGTRVYDRTSSSNHGTVRGARWQWSYK